MNNRTLVLAENYGVFMDYVKNNKLNASHLVYVSDATYLHGYRGVVIAVRYWWRNLALKDNADFVARFNYAKQSGQISLIKAEWDFDDFGFPMVTPVTPLPSNPTPQYAYS